MDTAEQHIRARQGKGEHARDQREQKQSDVPSIAAWWGVERAEACSVAVVAASAASSGIMINPR